MAFVKALLLALLATFHSIDAACSNLPVFFFHGITGNRGNGANFQANLTAEGVPFYPLTFCEGLCSVGAVYPQVRLAIAEIRSIIAANPAQFKNGYVFIGHSQGGAIARGVIEEMDDHNVVKFLSLSGLQNGIFYGPQPTDLYPTGVFTQVLGPQILPPVVFDFKKYTPLDWAGKLQEDFSKLVLQDAVDLQRNLSVFNMQRPPVPLWNSVNPFLAVLNNRNPCGLFDLPCLWNQLRRKINFIRVDEVHMFASPAEDVLAPWQTSIFGQYGEISSLDDIQEKFSTLKVVDMKDTFAYKFDTFGLRTLDVLGRLKIHVVPDILHLCWIYDYVGGPFRKPCAWQPLYDQHIYPVLQ